MKPTTRKRIAVLTGLVLVVLLAGGIWHVRDHIRFWWSFESLGTNAQGLPEYRHRKTGIVMVRLPGGTFWMGAQSEDPEGRNYDPDAEEDEGPVHEVTLSPFLITKYEVTQGQWLGVMGDNPSQLQPGGNGESRLSPELLQDEAWLELPVETVSWNNIQGFEEATGLALPTEAQWEYAARGGTSTPFSFGTAGGCDLGSCDPCPQAEPFMWWCGTTDSGLGPRSHEVGMKQPNSYGLHDMHGNVYEWCEDAWDESFYSSPEAAGPDPVSTSGLELRVVRGGGWIRTARYCRSADRSRLDPSGRGRGFGLRLSMPVP